MTNDVGRLISELADWNDGKGIDVASWISGIGQYDHAIGYCTIFWPSFVVHDDCVFRKPIDPRTYKGWVRETGGDRVAIEAVVNHQHILDLFLNSQFQPGKDAVLYIGLTLRDMWSCKLARDFPARQFEVVFPYGNPVQLVDYQITFFQIAEAGP